MAVKPGRVGKARSRKAATKRVKQTGSGAYAIDKPAHNHLLLQKSKRQKAKASKPLMLSKGESQKIAKMISV